MKPNKIKLCKEKGCRDEQTTAGFCRFHYLKNWKKLVTEKKKSDDKLEKFVNVLAEKYSDNIPQDDVSDDIIGRLSAKNPLVEIGLKEKDLEKDTDGNPFENVDVDVLLENIKYDDNY